jgi:hypothetical protein
LTPKKATKKRTLALTPLLTAVILQGAAQSLRISLSMSIKHVLKIACMLMVFITTSLAFGQARTPDKREVTLTGIELASDHRCSHKKPGTDSLCQGPNWALASGRTVYLLYGDENALQGFERKRVSISGLLEEFHFNHG